MTGLLSLIQEYLTQKTTVLNAQLNEQIVLRQIETKLDITKAPRNEKYINYQLYISGVEREDGESRESKIIGVRLDFIFQTANKNYTVYQEKFGRYVYNFERIMFNDINPKLPFADRDISDSITITDIRDVKITNTDRFEENIYNPSIEFNLHIFDFSYSLSQITTTTD